MRGVKVLDLFSRGFNAEDMANDAVGEHSSRPLLTLGRVDVVRVQVGYRAGPENRAYQQFLLDLPIPEAGSGSEPADDEPVLDDPCAG